MKILVTLTLQLLALFDFLFCYGFIASTTQRTSTFRFWTSSPLNVGNNIDELVPLNKGSTCSLITPMKSTGDIDVVGLKTLLQLHLDSGTDNICLLSTTGEASVVTMKERAIVLETAVNMCKGKVPLLAGIGALNTQSVKEMTQQAIDLGCDASLVLTPFYIQPPQRGLIQHFIMAADIGLPVVMYNVPGRTCVNFSDESVALCAEHTNIVGLEDATGDLSRLDNLLQLLYAENKRNKLLLYSGDDSTTTDFCLMGGDGCISVTANLAPKAMHQMLMTAVEGKADAAHRLNESLINVHNKIFCESNPIPAKWCAKKIGLIQSAFCRPPLAEMDSKYEYELELALRESGLFGYNILDLYRTAAMGSQHEEEPTTIEWTDNFADAFQ